MSLINLFKKFKVPALGIMLAFFIFVLFNSSKEVVPSINEQTLEAQEVDAAPNKRAHDHGHRHSHEEDEVEGGHMPSPTQLTPDVKKLEDQFSFQGEVEKVQRLLQAFPKTRKEIVSIISAEDIYKQNKVKIQPHTKSEIIQHQMGAVKVLALRELMKQQQDFGQMKQDLDYIIENAKDPTIRKIAEAAKGSAEKGRSFFDDFIEGIGRMDVPDSDEEGS